MTLPASTPMFESQSDCRPVSFTGEGGEYFRIWIVNLALSVLTLGLYSPWAKVRRLQYFYRHTRLAESGFDFHGDPIAILKGRLIGLALFGTYTLAGFLSPFLTVGAMVVIAGILPWLLAQSLRFRCHNTSYRGVRFRFHGSVSNAYKVFLVLPLLTIPTLGLLAPFTHHRIRQYQQGNAAFGRTPFAFTASVGDFYLLYLAGAGLLLVFTGALAALLGTGVAAAMPSGPGGDNRPPAILLILVGAVYVLGFIGFQAFALARVQNLVWSETRLGPHRISCMLGARRLFAILLTNLLATVGTLGLFRPYALVRLSRYMAGAFTMSVAGSLDFTAAEAADESATGEETTEVFGFDIGL